MSTSMRCSLLAAALSGCIGHAMLGEELADEVPQRSDRTMDGGMSIVPPVDGGSDPQLPSVHLTTAVTEPSCGGCYLVIASTSGGEPPYTFSWEDATTDLVRHICPGPFPTLYSATLTDGKGREASASIRLASSLSCLGADAGAEPTSDPATPRICLENGTFEGEPSVNLGTGFNVDKWRTCPSASGNNNSPDLLSSEIAPPGAMGLTLPPDGKTFAGLAENESISQSLCEAVYPGDARAFEVDLYRLPIGAGLVPETEAAFVRVWGGTATECSKRELLWISPMLTAEWRRFCVRVAPGHFTDLVTFEVGSDQSLGSPVYVLIDRVRPVDACP